MVKNEHYRIPLICKQDQATSGGDCLSPKPALNMEPREYRGLNSFVLPFLFTIY